MLQDVMQQNMQLYILKVLEPWSENQLSCFVFSVRSPLCFGRFKYDTAASFLNPFHLCFHKSSYHSILHASYTWRSFVKQSICYVWYTENLPSHLAGLTSFLFLCWNLGIEFLHYISVRPASFVVALNYLWCNKVINVLASILSLLIINFSFFYIHIDDR
jgi:hypothetical protein